MSRCRPADVEMMIKPAAAMLSAIQRALSGLGGRWMPQTVVKTHMTGDKNIVVPHNQAPANSANILRPHIAA